MRKNYQNWIFPAAWTLFIAIFFLTYLVPGAFPLSGVNTLESATQWYPYWVYARQTYLSGLIPLWSPAVFMGIPFASDPYTGVFHVLFLLFLPFSPARGITLMFLVHFLAAGLGSYLLARETGASKTAASSAAVVFALSGYFLQVSQFFPNAKVLSYTPLAFFLLLRAGRSNSLALILALSALTFLQITGSDPEMMLWQQTGMLAVALIRPRRLPAFISATIMGALLGAIIVLPTLNLTAHSVRAGGITLEFFLQHKASLGNLLSLFVPYRSTPSGQLQSSGFYMGMISIIFVLSALSAGNIKRNAALLAGALFILLVSLSQSPFVDIFYYLPLFKVTQLHYNAMVLFAPAFVVLFASGFDRFSDWSSNSRFPGGIIASIACIGMILVKLCIFGKTIDSVFLGAALPVLAASAVKKRKMIPLSLLVLAIADISPAMLLRYPRNEKPPVELKAPLVKTLCPQEQPARWVVISRLGKYNPVINPQMAFLFPPDSKLHALNGFSRVVTENSGKILSVIYPDYIAWKDGKLDAHDQDAAFRPPSRPELMRLLNVRYAVTHRHPPIRWKNFESVYSGRFTVYETTDYMPRAWMAFDWETGDEEQAKQWLAHADARKLSGAVFLAKSPGFAAPPGKRGTYAVNIEKYGPQRIRLSVDTSEAGVLFVSDTYYPGWGARVDGAETPIHLADAAFRAVPVDPGHHKVEMVYKPISFRISLWVTLVSLVALIAVATGYARQRRPSGDGGPEPSTG